MNASPKAAPAPVKDIGRSITLAHEILGLEKDFGAIKADYLVLDDIIQTARSRINTASIKTDSVAEARKALREIHKILSEKGFKKTC